MKMVDQKAREREQQTLLDQIRYIDSHLAEIEAITASLNDGSHKKSELLDEARSLSGQRNAAAHRLRVLDGTDDDLERERREQKRARGEQMRQAHIKSYRKQCEEAALECERTGDHRNAKLHRLESLNAARVAEWEIHE